MVKPKKIEEWIAQSDAKTNPKGDGKKTAMDKTSVSSLMQKARHVDGLNESKSALNAYDQESLSITNKKKSPTKT